MKLDGSFEAALKLRESVATEEKHGTKIEGDGLKKMAALDVTSALKLDESFETEHKL